MRRLVALAIALVALLAIADLLHEAPSPAATGQVTSGHLAAPPAPEPDVPSLTPAATNPPVTVRTGVVGEPARHLRPPSHVVALRTSAPARALRSARPRTFPLLI